MIHRILKTAKIEVYCENGPYIIIDPNSELNLSEVYSEVVSKWESNWLVASTNHQLLIFGKEPTSLWHSSIEQIEGQSRTFLIWRWLCGPKGWQFPQRVDSETVIKVQEDCYFDSTAMLIADPLEICEGNFDGFEVPVSNGRWRVSTYAYDEGEASMIIHQFEEVNDRYGPGT